MRQAKWTIAVDRWIDENDCDASAIQCWRSLQDNFGCATCLTMSMMGEKLMPSACEVDVMGAISMYALALAAEAPSAILDWNNNYGRETDKCVCTHCGNFPKSFIGETPEISELGVIGSVVGKEKCFGAVKGKVQPGPMTFFRASTDDRLGTIKAYVGEGEFTSDPFGMDGGIAVTKVARLRPLLGFIARNGFEHHVAMVRGNHPGAVHEAVKRYLNWPIHIHRIRAYGRCVRIVRFPWVDGDRSSLRQSAWFERGGACQKNGRERLRSEGIRRKCWLDGGEGGIRTPGTLARTPHFECGAIDHSATSPGAAISMGERRSQACGPVPRSGAFALEVRRCPAPLPSPGAPSSARPCRIAARAPGWRRFRRASVCRRPGRWR